MSLLGSVLNAAWILSTCHFVCATDNIERSMESGIEQLVDAVFLQENELHILR